MTEVEKKHKASSGDGIKSDRETAIVRVVRKGFSVKDY